MWCLCGESNTGPSEYETDALPTELHRLGTAGWLRTNDIPGKNRMLCQLSYDCNGYANEVFGLSLCLCGVFIVRLFRHEPIYKSSIGASTWNRTTVDGLQNRHSAN